MDKKIDALVDSTYVSFDLIFACVYWIISLNFRTEKLTLAGVGVNGIVVCDKSGLVLTSKGKVI